MKDFLKKIFPISINVGTKQIDSPFVSSIQRRFTELLGLQGRDTLSQNRHWVYACVKAIAEEVANINLKLVKEVNGEVEEVDTHEILDLINRVNPRMTKYGLFEITQSHQDLEGNAFWFLAKDDAGVIREIWPIRPDRIDIKVSKENPLMVESYMYRQKNGSKIPFAEEDIIHFAQFNSEANYPFPDRGMGTVEAARMAIETSMLSREWNLNFFNNSARPDLLLKSASKLTPQAYERLKREWNSAYQGTSKAHKMLILQGNMELDKLSLTQKDMDFMNQVVNSRDEILAMFRVPKTILGITDDVNRANAEASNFVFAQRTVTPKMQKIVDTLNEFLLPKFENTEGMFFTFTSPVPENREQIVAEYERGVDRWLSRNEIRANEGLPPTANGDQLFGQFSLTPYDKVLPQRKNNESTSRKKFKPKDTKEAIDYATTEHINKLFEMKEEEEPTKKKKKKAKVKEIIKIVEKRVPVLSGTMILNFWNHWKQFVLIEVDELTPKIQKFLNEQEKRVIESVMQGLKGLKTKEYSLKQARELLPDEESELSATIDLMEPEYLRYLENRGQLALELVGSDEIFNSDTEAVRAFISERSKFFSEKTTEITYDKLTEAIELGLADGENLEAITARIKDVYDVRLPERMARTEVSASGNFGTLQGYKQVGIEKKEWVNFDPPDDDSSNCAPSPAVVGIDETFSNGLDQPPNHPNCVCLMIAVFE